MKKIHVYTSAAFNYIPKVRILFDSLKKWHPEWVLHLVLADDVPADTDLSGEPFDHVMPIADLGIPDWNSWAFCHDIVELSTAIKPFMLLHLLSRDDVDKVIYMDPDTVAFSRLDDIIEAIDHGNMVLIPHQTDPELSLDAVRDNEISSLKHGVFNLGFLGVNATPEGRRFAEWWANRIYHFCVNSIPNGLFTDQKWIDLVPAFFSDVVVMRSPRHNVATWNLTTRTLSFYEGSYKVNDVPLGFYHFTGFDSGSHKLMAVKHMSGNAALEQLLQWYSELNDETMRDPLARKPWAFGVFTNGEKIIKQQRLVYRLRADLRSAFPDPFDSNSFLGWWKTQGVKEYPQLFDKDEKVRTLAAKRLSEVLPSGFDGSQGSRVPAKFLDVVLFAIKSKANFELVSKKAFQVIKAEGFSGIISRLR